LLKETTVDFDWSQTRLTGIHRSQVRRATYSTVDGKSAIGTYSHGPLCYIGNKNWTFINFTWLQNK